MNSSITRSGRPRFSEMLETQLDFFATGADAGHQRNAGRALGHFVTVLLVLLVLVLLAGQAVSAAPLDEVGAGSLLFRSDNGDVAAPLLETDVDIAVSGMVARVDVRQTFHNPGTEQVEGVYVFPLPDDAAVDTLKLHIGDRFIIGEIRERAAARKTYMTAREAGQRASLVEQQRPNLFTTAVANIAPGETVSVEIGYLQTLKYVQGAFSIRFPMTLTPRYEPHPVPLLASASPVLARCCNVGYGFDTGQDPGIDADQIPVTFHAPGGMINEAQIRVRIDAGFPLARIESLYHSMDTTQSGNVHFLQPAAGMVPMDRDLELVWQPALGRDPQAAVFSETWDGEDFALIMVMPPDTGTLNMTMPREIVYVIDTSGSMGGSSIEQARAALRYAIERLKPQDRFNIIRFASSARKLFPEAVHADESRKRHAIAFVDNLRADGGTEIASALDLALDEQADRRATADAYLRQVVFVTDGSVGNERELFGQINAKLGNTRLFTVGIGSAPNDWFMRKGAEFGRGTYTHIGGDHMIEERMDSLLTRLEQPVLRDIEIEAPPGAVVSPQRIRDLYAGEPIVLRAKLSSLKGEFLLRGQRMFLPWQTRLSLDERNHNPGVAALWGRGRIEALMDSIITGADEEAVRAEVVQLGLRHHLVSRYTSLVAVDYTSIRAPGTQLNSKLVAANPPLGSTLVNYPAGATPAPMLALFGMLTLLFAAAAAVTGRRQ